jgi:hypothetical protein
MQVSDDETLTLEEWVEWEDVGWHPPIKFAGNGGLWLFDDYPDRMPVWVRTDAPWPLPANIPATVKWLKADPTENIDRSLNVGPEVEIEQLARRTMYDMPINKWVEKRILHTADGIVLPRLARKYRGYEHMDIRWHVRAGDGLVLVLTEGRRWEPRVELVAEAMGLRPPPPLYGRSSGVSQWRDPDEVYFAMLVDKDLDLKRYVPGWDLKVAARARNQVHDARDMVQDAGERPIQRRRLRVGEVASHDLLGNGRMQLDRLFQQIDGLHLSNTRNEQSELITIHAAIREASSMVARKVSAVSTHLSDEMSADIDRKTRYTCLVCTQNVLGLKMASCEDCGDYVCMRHACSTMCPKCKERYLCDDCFQVVTGEWLCTPCMYSTY